MANKEINKYFTIYYTNLLKLHVIKREILSI